jgi:hypothetical protein
MTVPVSSAVGDGDSSDLMLSHPTDFVPQIAVETLVGRVHPLRTIDRDEQDAVLAALEAQAVVGEIRHPHPAMVSPPLTLRTWPVM